MAAAKAMDWSFALGVERVLPNYGLFGIQQKRVYNSIYYTTSSASGQDELNLALWLATRTGKMELSCPLGLRAMSRKESLPCLGVLSHIINPLLTKLVRSIWLDIQPSWPHAWPITHTYYVHFEVTGDPWNLIGSQQCNLFTSRTGFCFKSHIFCCIQNKISKRFWLCFLTNWVLDQLNISTDQNTVFRRLNCEIESYLGNSKVYTKNFSKARHSWRAAFYLKLTRLSTYFNSRGGLKSFWLTYISLCLRSIEQTPIPPSTTSRRGSQQMMDAWLLLLISEILEKFASARESGKQVCQKSRQ